MRTLQTISLKPQVWQDFIDIVPSGMRSSQIEKLLVKFIENEKKAETHYKKLGYPEDREI